MTRGPRTGDYRHRVQILRREVGAKGDNGADAETWPDCGPEYSAARDQLTSGETIAQGVNQTDGFMRLRIKGQVTVARGDRLLWVATGVVYRVTVADAEVYDTLLSVERLQGQATEQ